MDDDLRYPLHYPVGWARSKYRAQSKFDPKGTRTFATARDQLLKELKLLGAKQIVLSTNVALRQDGLPYSRYKEPVDPGVAVYFQLKGKPLVLACDSWKKVIDNVWAIACHVSALRGIQRWNVGTLEQAFMGYEALPPSVELENCPWWQVLGVSADATEDAIKAAYRDLARSAHPDAGGSLEKMQILNAAYSQARRERGEK